MRYGGLYGFFAGRRAESFSVMRQNRRRIFSMPTAAKHAEKRNVGVQITGAYFKQELKDGEADPCEPQDI